LGRLEQVQTTATARHGPSYIRGREPALWDLVGETPLIPLKLPEPLRRSGASLLLKAEWKNPGGSVKDRPAREILRDGITSGALPRLRLLDASSGNTAVAYAMLGAAAGIGVTVCVPSSASPARKRLIRLYGAELVETDRMEGSDGAIRRARELEASEPGRYWYADQYAHPANPRSHELTTGPEIWRDTCGEITHLVAGLGTSGTLMGAGRYLKEKRRDLRLIAVQPDRPFHGLEGLKHMATAIVPRIYDPSLLDQTVFVATEDAEDKVRGLAAGSGLFVGWSTGAALVAAELVLARSVESDGPPPVVVVIAPDSGAPYLYDQRRLFGEG
jgi:cysteine synthase B